METYEILIKEKVQDAVINWQNDVSFGIGKVYISWNLDQPSTLITIFVRLKPLIYKFKPVKMPQS